MVDIAFFEENSRYCC